ncbi:MAG: class B sortase [Defluviitaleaceae bacterium]|nr:class B sortase [Defluviitaleaceae bacterium]
MKGNQDIAKALEDIAKGFGSLAAAVKELPQESQDAQDSQELQKAPEFAEPKENAQSKTENLYEEPKRSTWATFAVLGVLIAISFITGIGYWWTTYFRPAVIYEPITPIAFGPQQLAEQPIHEDDQEAASDVFQQITMDPRPEFVALWEQYQNNNIVARVYIEGTGVNVLVVQDEPAGEWPVYMDSNVNLLAEDQNTVIYDHSTYIFQHVLSNYENYDFFLQHPIISLSTLYEVSRWEIFSFYIAPTTFPFNVVNQETYEDWADMIMQFSLASLYNTRIDVTQYDRVLTLTTESTNNPNLKYVLQARLYREITS